MSIGEREVRNAGHQKQGRMQIRKGVPNVSELSEAVPVLRSVSGIGLVQYIRHNGELYASAFTKLVPVIASKVSIGRLTDGGAESGDVAKPSISDFNGAISNVLNYNANDDIEDDLAALAGKINEIIKALRETNIILTDGKNLDSFQR